MASISLVASELTAELIQAGERLLQRFDAGSTPITAAFWHLIDEETGWRLVLASPEVSRIGVGEFYGKVIEELRALGETELNVGIVSAVRPDDRIVSLLSHAIKTGPGISHIRLTGNVIGGSLIRDTLVYRLP